MLSRVILTALVVGVFSDDVTFKNVTLLGGSKPLYIKWHNSLYSIVPEKNIQTISFEQNDSIPVIYSDAIINLNRLEKIDLTGLDIERIDIRAFYNLPLLTHLDLNDNLLKEIKTGVFGELQNLTSINLKKNQIEVVEKGAFDNLYNLSFLFLGRNKLATFDPDWFNEKPFLIVVDLSENLIELIPNGAFDVYDNSIFLGDNQITNLSRAIFGSGTTLQQLSLHDNMIETWDEDLFEEISIISFDVTNNQVECLNGNFSKLFAADNIEIGGNPWDCDCLDDIQEWIETNATVYINLGSSKELCNITNLAMD